ncbi:MAG: vWA domain-containing protein [Polyangiaceae bacterium]
MRFHVAPVRRVLRPSSPRSFARAVRAALVVVAPLAGIGTAATACSDAPTAFDDETTSSATRGTSKGTKGGKETTPTFGGSSASDGGVTGACVKAKSDGARVPTYLAFVFDKSLSMGGGRFQACGAALKSFFGDAKSNGISASLQFFPLSSLDCSDGLYATPRVSMRELPDPNAFSKAIDSEGPNTFSTPALPAIRASIQYLRGVQKAQVGKTGAKYAIVLVTDGQPLGCGSSVSSVSTEVAAVKGEFPTYVIGLGDPAALDAIAKAGGTDKAFQIDPSDTSKIASSFGTVLDTIRGSHAACDFRVPDATPGEKLDPGAVNVVVTSSSGAGEALAYDKDCTAGGWRYDDPTSPARIQVCPTACTSLISKGASVDIEVGCVTKGTNGSIPR